MLCKKFVFIGLLSLVLFTKQCTVACSANLNLSHENLDSSKNTVQYHTPAAEQTECPAHIHSQLAPTLAIMKMFLGPSFKALPSDFKCIPGKTEYPQELYDNVRAFFGSPDFTPPKDCLGSQQIDLDDELTNTICKLIRFEQEENIKGNVVLYHGLDGSILFMYRYFSELFSHLTKYQFPKFVLRGDHLYALNPKTKEIFQTLKEVREIYKVAELTLQVGDYGQGIDVRVLHCNIALSVGPETSLSSASSIGFLCNSFNARKISIIDTITSTLVFQGMPTNAAQECAEKAEALFKRNFLTENHESNGGILAISLPKNQIDNLALHVYMNGREYNPTLDECEKNIRQIFEKDVYYYIGVNDLPLNFYLSKIDSSSDVVQVVNEIEKAMGFGQESWSQHLEKSKEDQLTEVIQKYIDSLSLKSSSISTLLKNISVASEKPISRQAAIDLTNEIALYLHPQMQAKILGLFRHMPEPSQEPNLRSEFEKLVEGHVQAILKSPFRPVDKVLAVPTAETSGITSSRKAPIDAIPFLIERGLFEEAEALIKEYPDFYKDESIKIILPKVITSAIEDGFMDISNVLIKKYGMSFKKIINKDEFPILMPELIQGCHKHYDNMVDILLNEDLSEEELIQIAKFVQSCAHSHEDYFNRLLEKCKSNQDLINKIFQQTGIDGCLNSDIILNYMKHGFSFNTEDPVGRKHFDMLFKFFRNKTDRTLVESIANIITFYQLNLSKHKELCVLLAGSGEFYFGNKLSVECTPTGYKISYINDKEKSVDISFDDLNVLPSCTFGLSYGISYDSPHAVALCKYFTTKFGRTYPIQIFQKLCETKEVYSFSRSYKNSVALSLETSSSNAWLKALNEAKSWNEAEKLVPKVEDLDVLFFNLGLSDKLASGASKEEKENFVNNWLINLMEASKKTINEITELYAPIPGISGVDSTTDKQRKQLMNNIIANAPKFISNKCYFYRGQDLIAGKYCFEDIRMGCPIDDSDKEIVRNFIEKEIQDDPNKLEDIELVTTLLSRDILPESIVGDKQQLEIIFSKIPSNRQFYIACDLLKSDNPVLVEFIKGKMDKIFYPGTSVKMQDAMAVLAKYNMLDHDNT